MDELLLHGMIGVVQQTLESLYNGDVMCNSTPRSKNNSAVCKKWVKPVIKWSLSGNGQLTACVVLGGVEKTSSLQGRGNVGLAAELNRTLRQRWQRWAELYYKEIIGGERRNWQPTIVVTAVECLEDSC